MIIRLMVRHLHTYISTVCHGTGAGGGGPKLSISLHISLLVSTYPFVSMESLRGVSFLSNFLQLHLFKN